jgi:predicted DNA-binding ribbon-helix-helix protein
MDGGPLAGGASAFLEGDMCKIYAQTDPIVYECRARSVRISGVTTTIRLENLFWQTLSELASDNDMTTNQLIAKLHEEITQHLGETTNFASFLRVTCLRYQGLRANASMDFRSHGVGAGVDKIAG